MFGVLLNLLLCGNSILGAGFGQNINSQTKTLDALNTKVISLESKLELHDQRISSHDEKINSLGTAILQVNSKGLEQDSVEPKNTGIYMDSNKALEYKTIIFGGSPVLRNVVEILSLDGYKYTCPNITSHLSLIVSPNAIGHGLSMYGRQHVIGGHQMVMYQGRMTICGGGTNDIGVSSISCQQFDADANHWYHIQPMNKERVNFGAVVTPFGLFVFGGEKTMSQVIIRRFDQTNHIYAVSSSTSVPSIGEVFDGHKWKYIDSPIRNFHFDGSCLVQLNTTHTVLIGGGKNITQPEHVRPQYAPDQGPIHSPPQQQSYGSYGQNTANGYRYSQPVHPDVSDSDRAFVLDWTTLMWTEVARMHESRISHSCLLMEDGSVLVAGGVDSKTTEIYNPEDNEWRLGPELPVEEQLQQAGIVMAQGKPTIIGGADQVWSNRVIQLVDGHWVDLNTKLVSPRYGHTATRIPIEALSGCKKLK